MKFYKQIFRINILFLFTFFVYIQGTQGRLFYDETTLEQMKIGLWNKYLPKVKLLYTL